MGRTLILVAIAAVAAYLTGSFLQAFLHRWLGHAAVGSFFQRRHVFDHHRIYSPRHLKSSEYSDVERSLTPYYAVPVGGAIALLSLVLPLAPFVSFTTTLLINFGAHAYLHKHYHLEHTWLERSHWFRRRRDLHYVHHRDARRNYAVIGFFWDRLFGTFTDAPRHNDAVIPR
jgi:sterol desaturase/sphingolipid hydroxylase (fatty acid hydroxylase superfamily)